MHAKSFHSRLTLCDPIYYSLPGSSVHGISRQEYWSGFPCPPPWDLLNPGIKPASLMSPALAGGFFTTSATWKAPVQYSELKNLSFCSQQTPSGQSLSLFFTPTFHLSLYFYALETLLPFFVDIIRRCQLYFTHHSQVIQAGRFIRASGLPNMQPELEVWADTTFMIQKKKKN